MKQFLGTACLTIVALIGLAQITEAKGLFRRSSGCGSTPCAAPCEAPCAAPAPAPIQYEERKITVYKNVMVEREIEVLECRRVMSEEKYTFMVSVPVWNEAKRLVTYCTPVSKQVEYTYTVLVPKTMQKKVNVTTYNCVTETVVEKVPFCRTICVQAVDECGRCYMQRQTVTETRDVTRCIVKRIPVVTEQMVNYTVCEPVTHKGMRTVCEIVRNTREETYKVCSYTQEKREGVRTVCNVVTEKVKRKVQVCERVASEQVIRVAIAQPCAAPCATTSYSNCGGHRGGMFNGGGLFRRGGGGCCN